MRIGFDLRPFLREETGVGVYLRNLLFALARIDRENEYCLFSASWKDRFLQSKIPPFARLNFRDRRIPVKALNFFWTRWAWPRLDVFFGARLDLTHSATPLLLPARGKKIATVHDLFFMDFPEEAGREAGKVFFRQTAAALRRADGIITFAEFTRNEIVARFGVAEDKVKVIRHGLDGQFLEDVPPGAVEGARTKYGLPPSFVLFVGAQEPRKNLPRLIEALRIVHHHGKVIPLVLAGPRGEDSTAVLVLAQKLGLTPWVKLTGYLPPNELRFVYRAATVFVFPSLCEGFGLPLLEAMACGVPVAASFVSAIPEVCGDAAVYFPPEDPEKIAEKILLLLEDKRAREDLIAKGEKRVESFSWARSAEETLRFYQQVGMGEAG